MKAVVLEQFGGPEQLQLADRPMPSPGPGQIRVEVRAAGVNPLDGKIRSGAAEAVFPTPLPAVLGLELAGVVDALGDGVSDVAVGDRVVGWAAAPAGSYAEYALSTKYAQLPEQLDFTTAVTLPVAGEAATRVLDLLAVGPGDTLLIHGASGAVGEVAVQLAIGRGATVIGTASEANLDRVRALGAQATRYGAGLVERVRELAPAGIDAVFDAAGQGALPDSIELRGGTDRIITIADNQARELGVVFSGGGASSFSLPELLAQAARGEVRTTIGAVFPFSAAEKAHLLVGGGHTGGKVVLTP